MPKIRDPEATPVLSHEERKAEWERAIIEEVEAWREAAAQFGVQNPRYLTTHILSMRQQVAFLDHYLLNQNHSPADDEDYFVRQYELALRMWNARETFLKKLFADQAAGMVPLTVPPPK